MSLGFDSSHEPFLGLQLNTLSLEKTIIQLIYCSPFFSQNSIDKRWSSWVISVSAAFHQASLTLGLYPFTLLGGEGRYLFTPLSGEGQYPFTLLSGEGQYPFIPLGGEGQYPFTLLGGEGQYPFTLLSGEGQYPFTLLGGEGQYTFTHLWE